MLEEDTISDMAIVTTEITEKNGYDQYEVSSFGRNGARGIHNLGYWKGVEYIGIGPGAHGRVRINGTNYRTYRVI